MLYRRNTTNSIYNRLTFATVHIYNLRRYASSEVNRVKFPVNYNSTKKYNLSPTKEPHIYLAMTKNDLTPSTSQYTQVFTLFTLSSGL